MSVNKACQQTQINPHPYRWINLFIYIFVCLASAAGFSSKSAMLSIMAERWSINLGTVALLITVFTLWQVLLSLPAGILANRFGFKPVVLTAITLTTTGLFLRSTADSFLPFMLFTIIAGIGWGLTPGLIGKVTANWFPVHERGQANGYFPAGLNGGLAVGSLTSVFLITRLGWNWGWSFYGFLALTALLLALFGLKERPDGESAEDRTQYNMNVKECIRQVMNRVTIPLQYTMMMTSGLLVITPALIVPHLIVNNVSPGLAGAISSIPLFGGVVGTFIIPTMAFRCKMVRKAMLGSSTLSILFFLSIFFIPFSENSLWLIILLALIYGFFTVPMMGLSIGVGQTQPVVNPGNAGILSGIYVASAGLGNVISSQLLTRVIDAFGGNILAGVIVQATLLLISVTIIHVTVFDK